MECLLLGPPFDGLSIFLRGQLINHGHLTVLLTVELNSLAAAAIGLDLKELPIPETVESTEHYTTGRLGLGRRVFIHGLGFTLFSQGLVIPQPLDNLLNQVKHASIGQNGYETLLPWPSSLALSMTKCIYS